MSNIDWAHFNDNDSKEGVEGRWSLQDNDHAVFYITGTNHKIDWKRNFQIRLAEIEDGIKVNQKDLLEAQWVVEYIASRIDLSEGSPVKKITVSGHSRGGAVAQIVVYKLMTKFPHLNIVGILLASKRTGNRHFVKAIREKVVAYRHRGDIVPHVPPYPFYRVPSTIVFGKWTALFWKAHMPKSYSKIYNQYNLR